MADNYLEKRMDDYRSGRDGSRSRSTAPRRGVATIKYPRRNILVVGGDSSAGRATISTFVGAGCLVAFTADDAEAGRRAAHDCGGRFYPMSVDEAVADMQSRGEQPEVIVIASTKVTHVDIANVRTIIISEMVDNSYLRDNSVAIEGCDAEQAAMLCLILAHPSSTVRAQVIRL